MQSGWSVGGLTLNASNFEAEVAGKQNIADLFRKAATSCGGGQRAATTGGAEHGESSSHRGAAEGPARQQQQQPQSQGAGKGALRGMWDRAGSGPPGPTAGPSVSAGGGGGLASKPLAAGKRGPLDAFVVGISGGQPHAPAGFAEQPGGSGSKRAKLALAAGTAQPQGGGLRGFFGAAGEGSGAAATLRDASADTAGAAAAAAQEATGPSEPAGEQWCAECKVDVPRAQAAEHADYHFALSLQAQEQRAGGTGAGASGARGGRGGRGAGGGAGAAHPRGSSGGGGIWAALGGGSSNSTRGTGGGRGAGNSGRSSRGGGSTNRGGRR